MQVLPRLHSGGVERVTVDTAGFLAAVDSLPTYVVSAGGLLVEELERRGVHHLTMPVDSKNPLTIIRNGFRLAKTARRLGVDLFHVRSRAPAWSVNLASKISGIPYISTYHGAYRNKGTLSNWYNSGMVRGKCVITISEFVGGVVKKDHAKLAPLLVKIYPGIDTDLFSPDRFSSEDLALQRQEFGIPEGHKVLLIIGRIVAAKRFDMAIASLAQIQRKDIHLVMAGSDQGRTALTEELLASAERLGVRDKVHFVRDFKNLPLLYAVSDIILFPTQHIETYGRITAEAGAMGKIIIAANMGAVGELIDVGKTGFLVPPGDFEALVQMIDHVLSLPDEKRYEMEQQALAHVRKNFSAHRMYEETLKLYQRVLGNG